MLIDAEITAQSRYPQKAHPSPQPRLHADFGGDWSNGASPGREAKESKKKENKARKETYSGKLGVRPDHPRLCMPGGLREVVTSFKFCQNRLNGFRDVWSKFVISYT